jgi:hypothetical protein
LFGSGFGKYLLYALGEIILVVIGILLAISINDHYKQKEINEKTTEIAQDILSQMKLDNQNISDYLNYLTDLEKTIEYYRTPSAERKGKRKPLKNVNKLSLFFDRENNFLIVSDMVNTQIKNYNFTTATYAQLLYNIQADYSYGMKNIQKQVDHIQQQSAEFDQMLAKKYDWYNFWMEHRNCKNDCTSYIRNNLEFDKELIAFKYEKTFVYRIRIEEFQAKLQENIQLLSKALSDTP